MRSSSSASRRPSLSRALYASSSAILPASTPLAIIAGWERLERAEHPELAVVLAAGRHGVHVRAHHDGRQGLGARALAEDIAHLVHAHAEPRALHARDHPVTAAPVLVRERQAGEPAARRLADPSQLLDALLEPSSIDLHEAIIYPRFRYFDPLEAT